MKVKQITTMGLMIAMGIIIPQCFHLIGGPLAGRSFLPMHLTVLLSGLLFGPLAGAAIGVLTVCFGMITGMPTPLVGFYMVFELGVYGFVTGVLRQISKLNLYLALIGAMLSGRVVVLFLTWLTLQFIQLQLPPSYGSVMMFVAGVPGIILQVIIIPPLYKVLEKAGVERLWVQC